MIENAIFVYIDGQNGFFNLKKGKYTKELAEIEPTVKKLLSYAKKKKMPVLKVNALDPKKNEAFFAKLKTYKHKELVIFGLILDYGVELIGLKLAEGGYKIYLPVDAVKPINEKNREPVMKELRAKGIEMWNTAAVIGELAAN